MIVNNIVKGTYKAQIHKVKEIRRGNNSQKSLKAAKYMGKWKLTEI